MFEVEFCEDFSGNRDGLGWWLRWVGAGCRVVVDCGDGVGWGGEVCPAKGDWGPLLGQAFEGVLSFEVSHVSLDEGEWDAQLIL